LSRIARYRAPVRVAIFVLVLLTLWLPLAVPIYWLGRDANSISILTMLLLYGEFIFLLRLWGTNVYRQRQILQDYGLVNIRRNWLDLGSGLVSGLIAVLCLFGLEGWLGWLVWLEPSGLPRIILEGFVVAIAVCFAEELVFRGWLLDELQRDYAFSTALWVNAFIFALLHFIKPLPDIVRTLPQFPALLLLGLTLVWAKRWKKNRLGLSIGFHAGLVWGYYIINVGQLIKYSGQVPGWITGVNRNPLAGVMGLLMLSVIALWMRRRSLNY